ncbi:DinB family protein [Amycolatopsis viridis]|uniref:Damage-inducible protein DinB n=1 Tax=Amycolatopsis viridis TaxID=185678 RepID=A0ABX0T321_9PSEU|nr:DinB family protein [Amycolatopsis viridis]NIH82300.1 putative damage-inducible protein DinB [Amycolatopsis viridis]
MPGKVRPVADERDGLLAFLAQQRYVLRLTAHGLTDEQARLVPTRSALSVGGLIKHVTSTERSWMAAVLHREKPPEAPTTLWCTDFRLGDGETLGDVLAAYDDAARSTEEIVAGVADLGQAVPVPREAPWFPDERDACSVRWVLLHLIQETARHTGHADIVREHIDGATALPLMSAAERWPVTPWLQPWRPGG